MTNSEIADYASEIAQSSNPEMTRAFVEVVRFILRYPELAFKMGKRGPDISTGTQEYLRRLLNRFVTGRSDKRPSIPATISDSMVQEVLRHFYEIPEEQMELVVKGHRYSMAAENFVGELLERYLASVLEPLGWVWCSGAVVRSVDFIKPPEAGAHIPWKMLQVKNRDNSENSSSSQVRDGTDIEKWFRSFSKTGGQNWEQFPDKDARGRLSEAGFKSFVNDYFEAIRRTKS